MLDQHEQEEKELQEIADTKTIDSLLDHCDVSACEQNEDGGYGVRDGFEAGLRKSKKSIWTVEVRDEPGEARSFDEATYTLWAETSFAKVKARINKLPNRE